jgi:hypothetical protein
MSMKVATSATQLNKKQHLIFSQFSLLTQRRFAPFFWTQFLGAFNDNLFKTALLVVLTYDALSWTTIAPALLNNLIPGLFILPYVCSRPPPARSPTRSRRAGWRASSSCSRSASCWWPAARLDDAHAVAAGRGGGRHGRAFDPVRPGQIRLPAAAPEAEELVGGNGVIEMGTFVGILLGEVMGAVLVGHSPGASQLVAGGTLLMRCWAWRPAGASRLAGAGAGPEDQRNFVAESVRNLNVSRQNRTVFLSMLGNSWFWFYGALVLSQFPLYAKDYLHGDHSVFVLLLTVFSLGIGAGSLLCEKLSGRKVEIGLVPFGAIGLSLFGIDLYFASLGYTNTGDRRFHRPAGAAGHAAHPGRPAAAGRVRRLLHRAAVRADPDPLRPQARVAHHRRHEYPERAVHGGGGRRGHPAAGQGFTIPEMFLTTALLNAVVALYIFSLVPEFLMRFLAWLLIHTIHRVHTSTSSAFPRRARRCWCATTSAMSTPSSSARQPAPDPLRDGPPHLQDAAAGLDLPHRQGDSDRAGQGRPVADGEGLSSISPRPCTRATWSASSRKAS